MKILEFEKKILLIGDAAVGKTSLVRRFVIDKFDDKYIITIGTKMSRKVMEFPYEAEGLTVMLSLGIWDILGQKGLESSHRVYFAGAEAFLLVLDGTRRETYDSLAEWARTVRGVCGPIPGILACNKEDLRQRFAVSDEDVKKIARDLGLRPMYTSAKTGQNVEEAFRDIGKPMSDAIVEKHRSKAGVAARR